MTAATEPTKKAKKANKAVEVTAGTSNGSAPAPTPQPGEPGYDWSQDYPDEKVFVYETLDTDRTVGLAALGPNRKFKPGELRKVRHLPEVDQMFLVIERVASPNALAVSDDFDDADYGRMFQQWSEWANTTAGES